MITLKTWIDSQRSAFLRWLLASTYIRLLLRSAQRALLTLLILLLLLPNQAIAGDANPFAMNFLGGVKLVVFETSYGPGSEELPYLDGEKLNEYSGKVLQEIFLNSNDFALQSISKIPADQQSELGTLTLELVLSVRNESGSKQQVASLSLRLLRGKGYENAVGALPFPFDVVPIYPATFPFIVQGDLEVQKLSIKKGILFLTESLPSYIACANNRIISKPCKKLTMPYQVEANHE